MAEREPFQPLFDADQAAEIFHLAARARPELPSRPALTLGELEQIGREVGIAPEEIRRAATLVGSGETRSLRVPVALSPEQLERAAELMQRRLGAQRDGRYFPGRLARVEGGLCWSSDVPGQLSPVTVTLRSRDGHTELSVTEGSATTGRFLPALIGWALCSPVLVPAIVTTAIESGRPAISFVGGLLVWVAAGIAAARWMTPRLRRRMLADYERRAREIACELEETLSRS